ncbi:SGNH/GDSL hydrolase family protein [Protaetiibacter mangrovi]|uniref:SGNH/GDSL hydrolase family protein n=1 Tax=Protaetiibacter mangrovi TaxID=2970926 RepID=A0ABT1ZCK3_9MICO|nr:SGNH/GDSL hydrolase family protein [Protaetiibacter mangrovi]MCS0498425.1 SGNH/GDSL hydrolase family protein [Protaetiibacter mangrovi]TPW94156.1 SGNH/GDSL hydrolase family protein [Schumannella luteola]
MNDPVHPRGLRASRGYMVLHGPRILAQKKKLEAAVERLPDAALPWEGKLAGPDPLRLLVIGDSTAAGTGAATQDEALPGSLARELQARTGRGVIWRAVGENGADTAQFLERHLTDALARPADLVFVSLGANDAIHARSARAFGRDLRLLLTTLSDRLPEARILMSNLPIFARFELLPDPLRSTLYRHSRNLERVARREIARDERWMITEQVPPPYGPGFFARDLFHPSSSGYADWARWTVEDAWFRGLSEIAHVSHAES